MQENVSAGGWRRGAEIREKLADEQELVAALANVVLEVYAR